MSSIADVAPSRNAAIDGGRAVCCFAVVLIHTASSAHFLPANAQTLTGAASIDAGHIIDQLCRFAVPYFFIATGYFMRRRPDAAVWTSLTTVLYRLAPPFFFWALLFNALSLRDASLLTLPGYWARVILQGGTAYHLWYLPGVGISLAIMLVSAPVISARSQVILGFGLFVLGLAIGPYLNLITSRVPSAMILHLVRDVFFGPVFVAVGIWLRSSQWKPTFGVAVCVFVLGAALQIAECFLIVRLMPNTEFGPDFTLATVLFGIGAFLTALTWPRSAAIPSTLVTIGVLGLGFYAVHPLFVGLLAYILNPQDLGRRLLIAAATIPLSYAAARLLAAWHVTRKVVI
jgi:surface polysaccharide O-acyltransferase-like enzyme